MQRDPPSRIRHHIPFHPSVALRLSFLASLSLLLRLSFPPFCRFPLPLSPSPFSSRLWLLASPRRPLRRMSLPLSLLLLASPAAPCISLHSPLFPHCFDNPSHRCWRQCTPRIRMPPCRNKHAHPTPDGTIPLSDQPLAALHCSLQPRLLFPCFPRPNYFASSLCQWQIIKQYFRRVRHGQPRLQLRMRLRLAIASNSPAASKSQAQRARARDRWKFNSRGRVPMSIESQKLC